MAAMRDSTGILVLCCLILISDLHGNFHNVGVKAASVCLGLLPAVSEERRLCAFPLRSRLVCPNVDCLAGATPTQAHRLAFCSVLLWFIHMLVALVLHVVLSFIVFNDLDTSSACHRF